MKEIHNASNEHIAKFMGLEWNHYEQLRRNYERDWSHLMPVVEKIKSLDLSEFNYNVSKMTTFRLFQEELEMYSICTPIHIIYNTIDKIVRWYNHQSQ